MGLCSGITWTSAPPLANRYFIVPGFGRAKAALRAVGRTAFSNYVLQTLICTTLFYGHGFGLFGEVDRARQFLIVLGVWAFQLLASSVWLRYFALGPVEWALRWPIYGRRPGLRRPSPPIAEA